VEGEGRKRVKIKFMEGRLALVDSATNEEMTLDRGGKFIKKSKILAIQSAQLSQNSPSASQFLSSATAPSTLSVLQPDKDWEVKQDEILQVKELPIDVSIFDVTLRGEVKFLLLNR
ncbi:MAG: hypothetical protein NC826_03085, partial [Candidatus Omnitrophica bacterium]|nr:hypothetical protein [Candidatus Omnitrophota bacterium]